jgi:hypothetical protein
MSSPTTSLSATSIMVERDVYIVVWPFGRTLDALRQCRTWAANRQLNLTWRDADVLGQRIRGAARVALARSRRC